MIENDLRATLHNFGLKVGMVAVLIEPLHIVRRVLREQVATLHRRVLAVVRDDDVCRRLMTVPGVGPVVALAADLVHRQVTVIAATTTPVGQKDFRAPESFAKRGL